MPRTKRILLVEDNADDEALTVRVLEQHKVLNSIQVVHDGAEAIEYLFGSADKPPCEPGQLPQVIMLDLKLPKVSGMDVLRRIRREPATRTLPVVILTSSSEEADLVNAYREGANSFVRKPVDFTEFSEAVERLGLYWLLLNVNTPNAAPVP